MEFSSAHSDRRRRLMEQLDDAPTLVRGAGADGVSANFVYLTGIEDPHATLLLAPGGARINTGREYPGPDYVHGRMARQILFLPAGNPMGARWGEEGAFNTGSVTAADAGVDAVLSMSALPGVLVQALSNAKTLHYVRGAAPSLSAPGVDDSFVESLRRSFFQLQLSDATPRVRDMRCAKDADEVRGIEKSVAVVAEALEVALRHVKPGVHEYEIEAEIARVYRSHRGTHAFDPIIATGANALQLHYGDNSSLLAAGQLLLIDTGVSIDGYKADISRTVPVDGRFSERQRELYEVVWTAQRQTIAECKPGALLGDLHATAHRALDAAGQAQNFIHGLGHHIGLETHDVGDVHRPLEPGAVITVEPGIYLIDEKIGIRIEDDVLITDDGHRVISAAIPVAPDEIERVMSAR